eukprot:304445-Prymnesium_polylepis.1
MRAAADQRAAAAVEIHAHELGRGSSATARRAQAAALRSRPPRGCQRATHGTLWPLARHAHAPLS